MPTPDVFAAPAAGCELVFKFGDGVTPTEGFTSECAINTTQSVELVMEWATSWRKACNNPSAPARAKRRAKSIDIKFSGSGSADLTSASKLFQLAALGKPFNGKAITGGVGGLTITGSWAIESITIGGASEEDQDFSISLSIADPGFTIVTNA